jgi:ABC-type sugar transport system ATPase subunit
LNASPSTSPTARRPTQTARAACSPPTCTWSPARCSPCSGPSGCGKTTLLRLIAGLEAPDAGSRIVFGGQDVTQRPVEHRGVGMVFQSYALFPQMTVAANIGYGLRIRGVAPDEEKRAVGELVDLVRLNGLENKRPAELSGGQRQRVALARAVAVRPRVLLLDEPLAALDAKLKESLRDELAELLRRLHITAIHVTHDQQEALAIADRLAVMRAGRIVQVGRGEDLYRAPAHPFVAEFLGRVNRLERAPEAIAQGVVRLGGSTLPCPPAWQEPCHAAGAARRRRSERAPARLGQPRSSNAAPSSATACSFSCACTTSPCWWPTWGATTPSVRAIRWAFACTPIA